MAALRDLTDEILLEILRCSSNDRSTLLAIARLDRGFNGLAIQLSARDIVVRVDLEDRGR